jgi:hypothetical protein
VWVLTVLRVEQSVTRHQGGARVSNLGRHSPEAELGRGGGWGEGEGPGGKPQVLEDGLGRRGTEDDCHDAAGAPAALAGENVGLERPLEELGPHAAAPKPRGPGYAFGTTQQTKPNASADEMAVRHFMARVLRSLAGRLADEQTLRPASCEFGRIPRP